MVVHDIELEAAALGRRLANLLDRLGHRRRFRYGHRVGRHEPPRRVFGIFEQLLNVLGLLLLHHLEEALGLRGRQFLDDLRRMVRRHLVEDARDLELVERLDELQQRLIVELGEHLARALGRQQAEDRHLRFERQLAQQRRHVGRMRGRQQIDEATAVAALEQRLHSLRTARGLFHAAYCPRLRQRDRA